MPTILDRFVVEFGLDPRDHKKGSDEVRANTKKTRDAVEASSKDIEIFGKRSGAAFSSLKNEVAGFVLALAGASTIKGFVQSIITGDAAVGRMAANLGASTTNLSAWGNLMGEVGGQTDDATAAFKAMAQARDTLNATMKTTGHDWEFRRLGITPEDLNAGPEATLLALSERRGAGMENDQYYAGTLRSLGMSEPMITVLKKGRGEVERLIEEQKRLGATTDRNAEQAAQFEKAMSRLGVSIKGAARPAVEDMAEILTDLDREIGLVNIAVPALTGLIGALTLGAIAAAPELAAIAAAIAAITAAKMQLDQANMGGTGFWDQLKSGMNSFDAWYYRTIAKGTKPGSTTQKWAEGWYNQKVGERVDDLLATQNGFKPGTKPVGKAILATGAGGSDPEIYNTLKARYGSERALGIAAGIKAEGGSLGMAANGAFGIGQWRGDRQRRLFKKYGRAPTKQQQLEFLMWELNGGDHGGATVLKQTTAEDTLSHYIGGHDWGFMRPGAGRAGDMSRGLSAIRAARGAGPSAVRASAGGNVTNVTSVGTIHVHTAATDAKGIAAELPGAISQRGLTTQANRGQS